MTSALSAQGSTRRWRRIRAFVLERDAFACRFIVDGRVCGRYATTVHHMHPRANGGGDDPRELIAACEEHNTPGQEGDVYRPPKSRKRTTGPDWSW